MSREELVERFLETWGHFYKHEPDYKKAEKALSKLIERLLADEREQWHKIFRDYPALAGDGMEPEEIRKNMSDFLNMVDEAIRKEERELMECGHPKACWVYGGPGGYHVGYCSFCAEREKVREILSWTLGELQGRGYSEIKPKHACGYTGNPEAAYCEFCDMWVKAQEYLNPTVPSSTEEGKK